MSIKNKFISKGINKSKIGEYLASEFKKAGYSHCEIRRTPLGMNITVFADRVGMVIGRGGQTINMITDRLKNDFGLENPRLSVQQIDKPFLNAAIVAEEIKNALEKSVNHRKIVNIMMKRVMDSGAAGIQVIVSGRMSGAMRRVDKFQEGYMKHSGNYAKTLVSKSIQEAFNKLGSVGVKVKIMKEKPGADIEKLRAKMEKKPEEVKKLAEEASIKEMKCPHCGKQYETERSLKIHIGQKHGEKKEGE